MGMQNNCQRHVSLNTKELITKIRRIERQNRGHGRTEFLSSLRPVLYAIVWLAAIRGTVVHLARSRD
jgi:hypothetical protein